MSRKSTLKPEAALRIPEGGTVHALGLPLGAAWRPSDDKGDAQGHKEVVLPIAGRVNNGNGTGIRASPGSPGRNIMKAASLRATPPRARDSNIVNAVGRTAIGNPSERGGVCGRERGRDTQIKLGQEAVKQAATQVLLLAEPTTTNIAGHRRAKTGISIHKKDHVRLTSKPARQVAPPSITDGSIHARVRRVCDNNSTLQAPGSDTHYEDPRVSKDGNKIRHPEVQVLTINAGIRLLRVGP